MSTQPVSETPERIGAAYDAIAGDYDADLHAARWMRRALWLRFGQLFRDGDRVLDVGCGTGIDTLYLARLGVRVTSVDASAGMVEELRKKVARAGLEERVESHVGDVTEVLSRLSGPFDGLVSSFAPLNTVDLAGFSREATRLLGPGRPLVAQLLSPAYGRRLPSRLLGVVRPPRASRRAVDIRGHHLDHAITPREEVYARFFREGFAEHPRSWLRAAMAVASVGRFYVLDLERRQDGGAPIEPPR